MALKARQHRCPGNATSPWRAPLPSVSVPARVPQDGGRRRRHWHRAAAQAGGFNSSDEGPAWRRPVQEPGGFLGFWVNSWSWACSVVDGMVVTAANAFMDSPLCPSQSDATRDAAINSIRGALALTALALLKGVISLVLVLGAVALGIYTMTQVFGLRGPSFSGRTQRHYSTWNSDGDPRVNKAQSSERWETDGWARRPTTGPQRASRPPPPRDATPAGAAPSGFWEPSAAASWDEGQPAAGRGGVGGGATWAPPLAQDPPAFEEAARARRGSSRPPNGGGGGGGTAAGFASGREQQQQGAQRRRGPGPGGQYYTRNGEVIDVFYDPVND